MDPLVGNDCPISTILHIFSGLAQLLPPAIFWEIFHNCVNPLTHHRVYVRFGKTKGEIRAEKGDFRGGLGRCRGV